MAQRTTTMLLSMLMEKNQPYSEAMRVPGDVMLEILEARLDDGLSYLEGDNPRRARDELRIRKEFGSVEAFVSEAMRERRVAPTVEKEA